MGIGIGSIAIGIYLGTLGGMIVKYYRVKKFFAEQREESSSFGDSTDSYYGNDSGSPPKQLDIQKELE